MSDYTFAEYDEFVRGTSRHHDDVDPLPDYAVLGMTGEAGELLELTLEAARASVAAARAGEAVKKARRGDGALDVVKWALEAGDQLWYVGRGGQKVGVPIGVIAEVNAAKLRRRKSLGKDSEAEYKLAADIIARHRRGGTRCQWCDARPAGAAGYCSDDCRAFAMGLT